jgi:hypothetical protein
MKAIAKNLLLAFVLVSIGFALGKEVTIRRQSGATAKSGSNSEPTTQNSELKIIVYYLHTTFRCVTCNEIERLAKTLVETEYAEDLAAGRIEWREADFQQDEALAKRFNVVASCVVVANVEDGQETGFQRLDDVWTRYENPSDFNQYVGSAINKYLEGEKK